MDHLTDQGDLKEYLLKCGKVPEDDCDFCGEVDASHQAVLECVQFEHLKNGFIERIRGLTLEWLQSVGRLLRCTDLQDKLYTL